MVVAAICKAVSLPGGTYSGYKAPSTLISAGIKPCSLLCLHILWDTKGAGMSPLTCLEPVMMILMTKTWIKLIEDLFNKKQA